MIEVRVLAGTKKAAFILTSDGDHDTLVRRPLLSFFACEQASAGQSAALRRRVWN